VSRIRRSLLAACASLIGLAAGQIDAHAQAWPSKPIRLVVPYQPGGVIDAAARVLAPKIQEAWGQTVIIDNKPGGSGTIGTQFVVKSAPDGYTLVIATLADFSVNPWLVQNIPYTLADLAPVAILTSIPTLMAVHAGSSYQSVADIIADAKTKPGKISYATSGNGSINQIVMEIVALKSGTKFQHIPYKGGAPASTAVAAGDVPIGNLAITGAIPFLRSGKIRIVATSTDKRLPANPEWPTLRELGLLDIDGSNWTGIMAPKATPRDVVEKLNTEINKILAMPDVRERLLGTGGEPIPTTVAAFAERVAKETAIFKEIAAKANIKAE
jgi:tripartite-type tricarboxylate transporter receptor subunit TctC